MEDIVQNFQEANTMVKMEILNQIPTTVMAVDKELRITYMNHAGLKAIGKKDFKIFWERNAMIFGILYTVIQMNVACIK